MQGQNALLKLNNYKVETLEYKLNPSFNQTDNQVQMPFAYSSQIIDVNDDNFTVQLAAKISKEDFPFEVNVIVSGDFFCERWKELNTKKDVELTVNQILFPYVRALISNITSAAGVNPIILPIINVAELLKDNK